ncbi:MULTISPECIES: hypothetical protein [unclassified Bradyrhizobium]
MRILADLVNHRGDHADQDVDGPALAAIASSMTASLHKLRIIRA